MAANTRQRFIDTPGLAVVLTSTAITTRTVSGATGLTAVVTGSADGTRVNQLRIQAQGDTAAGMIWLWIYNSVGIADAFLFGEANVPAVTASNTVPAWSHTVEFDNFVLPNNYQLMVSSTVTNTYAFVPFVGSF